MAFRILFFFSLCYNILLSQSILIDGLATRISSDSNLPIWLNSGTTIEPIHPTVFISALEFNLISNADGNDMVFNQILKINSSSTVPPNKVWKVESVLDQDIQYNYDAVNDSTTIVNSQFFPYQTEGNFLEFEVINYKQLSTFISIISFAPDALNYNMGGIVYSKSNSSPTLNDNKIYLNPNPDCLNCSQYPFIMGIEQLTLKVDMHVGFELESNSTYYLRGFISTDNGITYSDTKIINTPNLFVGKEYGGGIIAFLDTTGQHGTVVTQSEYTFYEESEGCFNHIDDFGSGYNCTQYIIENCYSEDLSLITNQYGYSDWYIPSKLELRYLADISYINSYDQYSYSSTFWNYYSNYFLPIVGELFNYDYLGFQSSLGSVMDSLFIFDDQRYSINSSSRRSNGAVSHNSSYYNSGQYNKSLIFRDF